MTLPCPLRLPGGRRAAGEAGMVTAELALLLPVLVAVTALLISVIAVAGAHLSVAEATRGIAREIARGAEVPDQREQLRRRWPGATLQVDRGDGLTTVTVGRPLRLPGAVVELLGRNTLRASATVADESVWPGGP